MKKLILILCAILAVCACSKHKKSSGLSKDLVGVWHLDQVTSKAAIGDDEVDVWLVFSSDKSFAEYQKLGAAGRYTVFTGKIKVSKGRISGTFSDGTEIIPWDYELSGSGELLLTRGNETDIYEKAESLPSEVSGNTY